MEAVLVDTDILSELLKRKNASVAKNVARYLAAYGELTISSMSRYEVLRGLKETNATVQLVQFQSFRARTQILPVTDEPLDLAADLWVTGRRNGLSPTDADSIIAATAVYYGHVLVTGNTAHFDWIQGLKTVNWQNL